MRHYSRGSEEWAFVAIVAIIAAVFITAILSGCPGKAQAADLESRWVTDQAGKLSQPTARLLEQKLWDHQKATTNQVVVVIVNSLEGQSVEAYTHALATKWKLGQKGKDNGVMLLIAVKERKIRIEVGYGLESKLTDAMSKHIISTRIVPNLKADRWDDGVQLGIVAILDVIK